MKKVLTLPMAAKNKVIGFKNWFMKASKKKKALVIVGCIILLIIATSPLRAKGPALITEKATRGTVVDLVSESGNVQAASQSVVYSPSTGIVEEVYVTNGEPVEVGQQLIKIQSTATAQEKAAAYAAYLSAQATLNAAQAKMNALQATLFAANQTFVNGRGVNNPTTDQKNDPVYIQQQATWLQAEADYKNQGTVIAQAQAALSSASLAYQATQDIVVTAPSVGTVANLSVGVGDGVVANTPTSPSGPVLYIGDFSRNIIKIPLNEVDVNKVKIGQKATITFDAMREKPYKGLVENIDTVGTNTSGVITYNAYITITNPDANVRPGMTVTVAIETARHENVITVPNAAVKPYQGAKAVIVPGKDKSGKLPYHYIPVKTGIKGITRTEIIDGITEDVTVVTGGITKK